LNSVAELGPEGVRRAFVALPAPPGLVTELTRARREWRDLDADIRWTDPALAHLTLRFLGPARRPAIEALDPRLRSIAAATAPVTVRAHVTGAFPGWRRARILWLGLEAPDLTPLARAIEEAARAAGFPAEEREFTPHLTLGRVRRSGELGREVEIVRGWQPRGGPETVGEFVLFRSELGPAGPRHSPIETYALTGKPVT
jgi:2'-5' RNA ligase